MDYWTIKEINYLKANYLDPNLTIKGKTLKQITVKRNCIGLNRYCVLPKNTVIVSSIRNDYEIMPARLVAKKHGIHINTVYNLVNKRKKTNKKWTDEEIEEAKAMKSGGMSCKQIANNLGRTTASIYEKLKPSKLE